MNEENIQQNQIEEESYTKTSNNMNLQIENLQKEFEFQNQQKNKELEVLFEEINSENQELKKELIQTKLQLEEEKQKTKNIKNTFLNINSSNITPSSQEEIKDSGIFGPESKYIYLNDHIKIIKENNEKKIKELNNSHNYKKKNFSEERKNYEQNLLKILKEKQGNRDLVKNILDLNEKFFGDIEQLMNDNYIKDKYIITLGEKYDIIKDEINFLKERIFQEKINILEKISEINGINNQNHFNMVQELQNELEENHHNFYTEQILGPLENINIMLSNIKQNGKEIENNRYKLECENEILKNKINILEQEKNELLDKSSNFIFDKESIISENLLYKSEINKLKNEIQIMGNENNNLLKNIKELNEGISNIKNKMNLDLKKLETNNKIILAQKDSLINELNKKNNILLQNEINYKNQLNDLNEQNLNLQQEINYSKETENKYQKELLELNKKYNQDLINSKDAEQRNSAAEEINKNLSQRLENLKSEKINIENASNVLNDKFNNINIEYNKIKDELIQEKQKNMDMESEIIQLKNKLTTMEGNLDLLKSGSDLLPKIYQSIKEIYQLHFGNSNINNNNNNMKNGQNNSDDILFMLKDMNEKLSNRNSNIVNQEINFNRDFADLENSKNSQLYENILLYLINIKSQNKIELAKILSEKNSNVMSNNNSREISQSMTHHSSSCFFNKKYLEELKTLLEDKYKKIENRIRTSVTIGELEELLTEFKNLYEAVIDNVIQSFYIHKTNLSENNILTIQIPLGKYHQIINNTNSNLISIEKSVNKKLSEYKSQGEKIESALSILSKNINRIY